VENTAFSYSVCRGQYSYRITTCYLPYFSRTATTSVRRLNYSVCRGQYSYRITTC